LAGEPRQNRAAAPVDPIGHGEPATILVVDDEPLAREMFRDLLEAQGFRVLMAARGEEALDLLSHADLVLLDAMLPGRDGWDLCHEIKSQRDPLLPIIMVTARTAPDDVVRTFAAGADDYIPKPFHVAELTARINSRLRVHRAELALHEANRRLAEAAEVNYRHFEEANRAAEERAILLRELDHRVRNNLSVIMGLVGMERSRDPAHPAFDAFTRLENRLRSFILVHEALRRKNFRGVPIREIIEPIAQRLRNSINVGGKIHIDVIGATPPLDERQGFALALAVNELITNALRHGFSDGRGGTIRISIQEADRIIRVEVADDGRGYLGGEPPPHVPGRGRSIVDALVRSELRGRVEYPMVECGCLVRLTFPKAPPSETGT
jgi:DNA-binding response OmpR family regulator